MALDIKALLIIAGVPDSEHFGALTCITEAKSRSKGLTWLKWKTRLFKAGKISKILSWESNRLVDTKPEMRYSDIAPMLNITAHGDNGPWRMESEGGRPFEDRWLDKDPNSAEYQDAVRHNYWCKGEHPRSKKSRKAWYSRNGGEFAAWERGMAVGSLESVERWSGSQGGTTVNVMRSRDTWIINAQRKLISKLVLDIRIGFEVDNIFQVIEGRPLAQAWYPCPGYGLRAPVTWGILPTWNNH